MPPSKNERKKQADTTRSRLLSIKYDATAFVEPLLKTTPYCNYPVIVNERCGSWYTSLPKHSCYFKSTDGHVNVWNFSLKRLNVDVIKVATIDSQNSGCIILDSSVRKHMPDSLSRTIPIWAATMNRIVQRYRQDLNMEQFADFDTALYVPKSIVDKDEYEQIEMKLEQHVCDLYESEAIADVKSLVKMITKPLRPYFVTPELQGTLVVDSNCIPIICIGCSNMPNRLQWIEYDQFYYSPGAADDQESWAHGLTPNLFWDNIDYILHDPTNMNGAECVDRIVKIVKSATESGLLSQTSSDKSANFYNFIGKTNLAIGSWKASRPPSCWNNFDAVLNVTENEHNNICEGMSAHHYLQLPVREGKRDKTELERWLLVGVYFCVTHLRSDRRVLVHCAQGKDRSVAVCIAVVILFCNLKFPLTWNDSYYKFDSERFANSIISHTNDTKDNSDAGDNNGMYLLSGLRSCVVNYLLTSDNRTHFLSMVKSTSTISNDINKTTMRRSLHLLAQDRNVADPSRSTMQKLNRVLMSGTYSNNKQA